MYSLLLLLLCCYSIIVLRIVTRLVRITFEIEHRRSGCAESGPQTFRGRQLSQDVLVHE